MQEKKKSYSDSAGDVSSNIQLSICGTELVFRKWKSHLFIIFGVAPLKPNLLPPLGGGRATASYRLVANHLNPAMEEHFATASDWLAKSRQ